MYIKNTFTLRNENIKCSYKFVSRKQLKKLNKIIPIKIPNLGLK